MIMITVHKYAGIEVSIPGAGRQAPKRRLPQSQTHSQNQHVFAAKPDVTGAVYTTRRLLRQELLHALQDCRICFMLHAAFQPHAQ